MSTVLNLAGITAKTIKSRRITTKVLFSGEPSGVPVVFLHGNMSSATWWEETMVALPASYQAIAPDLRGYGDADPAALIDATRGMGDLADDLIALLDELKVTRAHVVASSLGGVVGWRVLADHPERILTLTAVAPGSPYGFGATRDAEGTLTWPDAAGSGAGLIHPELVNRIRNKDATTESPLSLRAIFRRNVWNGVIPAREDALVSGALAVHIGEKQFPGDARVSPNWPFRAPGVGGPNNALSPLYVSEAVPRMIAVRDKPPILWIRGGRDNVVSDQAGSDPATLGMLKLLPGWPGKDVYPPQPMLAQTRAVLQRYAAAGGIYREVEMGNAGHVPFLEQPADFASLLHFHLSTSPRTGP